MRLNIESRGNRSKLRGRVTDIANILCGTQFKKYTLGYCKSVLILMLTARCATGFEAMIEYIVFIFFYVNVITKIMFGHEAILSNDSFRGSITPCKIK